MSGNQIFDHILRTPPPPFFSFVGLNNAIRNFTMGDFNKNSAECEACSVFSHIRSEHIDAARMEALSGN